MADEVLNLCLDRTGEPVAEALSLRRCETRADDVRFYDVHFPDNCKKHSLGYMVAATSHQLLGATNNIKSDTVIPCSYIPLISQYDLLWYTMTIKYHYRLYMAIGNIMSSISPSPTLRWGWFIACRCVCSAEAYVPALVSSACQSATGREIGDEDWGKVRVLSTNFGKNARNLIMVNHVWSCLVMFNNHVPFQNDHLEGMPFSDTQLILPHWKLVWGKMCIGRERAHHNYEW